MEQLSSTDPVHWQAWKTAFTHAANINGWNNQRARREIAASMAGYAMQRVDDIPINDVADAEDYARLLDAYEARFLPRAASDMALTEFVKCRQKEEESVLGTFKYWL